MRARPRFPFAIVLSAFLVAAGGCGEDSSVDPDTPFPHTAPGAQSMEMDFSDLNSTGRSAGPCHALSAVAVGWANLNVVLRLAIPVAAFRACVAQDPVFVGDNTWRWTASGGAGAGAWTAELEASPVGQVGASGIQIDWAMRISGTLAGHDRLLWFDGRSNGPGNTGYWTYYDPQSPASPRAVVRCDWALPGNGDDRTVAFENVDGTSADFGDVLTYQLAGTAASVSFDDAADGLTTIAWDTSTGAGTTTPAAGSPCCWGPRPDFPDTTCP